MESLSRPPHRRKHSASANAFSSSFSFKNPYDDVLLSNSGKKKSFGAHDYAEIFSGPSSIPVLDLSGLDERVGSGDRRSSKPDYTNIFGGLRTDEVAVPYEELFSRSAKKNEQRIPANVQAPLQEPDSQHSPEKTKKTSGEVSDGVKKQQFNMSFNKISQRNIDASNGKTHVAQLHAVSGFTYFVDGISQSQKVAEENEKPVQRPLKREVSRTWSFSAEVKAKGGLNLDKSQIPKPPMVNEISSKMSPPSTNKDPRKSSFISKQDDAEKNGGGYSPSFSEDEELDENSAAAVSAKALKKAIEQAQESIRIAKMIMKRKEEGLGDGSNPRSKGRSKVWDKKETRIDHEVYGSKEGSLKEKHEMFDGNFVPTFRQGKTGINSRKVVEERVRENADTAKELGTPLKVEIGKLKENVEATEVHREAKDVPGLVAHGEGRTGNFESRELENRNNSIPDTTELVSNIGEVETVKEILKPEVIIHQVIGGENVAELVEKTTFERMQELEKSVNEAEINTEQVERVVNTSHVYPEQCIVDEEDDIPKERENVNDDEGKHEKKFEENQEINVENPTLPRSVFDTLMHKAKILFEKQVPEQMKSGNENVPLAKGLGEFPGEEGNGMNQKEFQAENEGHQGFGVLPSEEGNGMNQKEGQVQNEGQLDEALEEELNEMGPEDISLVKEPEIEAQELEIDEKKENHVHEGDEPNLTGEIDCAESGEQHINASEKEPAEAVEIESTNSAEFLTSPVVEEVARSKENENESEIQEVEWKEDMDDAVDTNISYDNNSDIISGETQETNSVESINRAEENNIEIINVPETQPEIDEEKETEGYFRHNNNEVPETGCFNRSASEENFVGSKLFDGFGFSSSDGEKQYDGVMDEERCPKDEEKDVLKSNGEILDSGAKIMNNASDIKTEEIGLTDVRQVSEKNSESDQASVSSSTRPSVDGLSSDESQHYAEIGNEHLSGKEEVKDDLEVPSNERERVEEQSEMVYTEVHSEPEKMENPLETERVIETSQNMEENENRTGNSTLGEKDVKESVKNFNKDEHQQRIEAIKRGREREKDRIAVEKVIREARERAFAEARERAERAAVEKAAAEARQRALAEAREKLEKASMANKPLGDKQVASSVEARLRAERAAVERATAEARERAFEKAKSLKTSTEARVQVDRHSTSSSSRNNGLKHSFSSSDLDGANTESAQRRKARLERHQRIMERAAKALEEKNMRDLRAQKEQAERNRLAETLDADIKRWSSGKEGNLRALLSTLQYILGPDSGWQPISLTEIITTAAVKKAYRKATLYVHPDKLQQRGASIQQKYICEKVFDLLKAAWNRFNSEER